MAQDPFCLSENFAGYKNIKLRVDMLCTIIQSEKECIKWIIEKFT